MSFSLTTAQIIARNKTVTRRLGWKFLKVGDVLTACHKCQGLKKGEKVQKLARIKVLSTSWEPLYKISLEEVRREGFPEMNAMEFIAMFCDLNKCAPYTQVNRIEFKYLEGKDEKNI